MRRYMDVDGLIGFRYTLSLTWTFWFINMTAGISFVEMNRNSKNFMKVSQIFSQKCYGTLKLVLDVEDVDFKNV